MYKNLKNILCLFLFASLLSCLSSCASEERRSGISCGGGIEFQCPTNMYCQMEKGCGGIDSKGRCAPMPSSCPDEEDLICACDNNEYMNECVANTLGLSLKNKGTCLKKPTIEVAK